MQAQRLTTPQVCAMFGVTSLTILNWRKGTPTRKPLPTAKPSKHEPPNAVRFDQSKVEAWAKRHDIEIIAQPAPEAGGRKRGPKPRKPTS